MRALRAPDGCSQYFTKEKGALASLNFDGESAIMANQDYSICFKSSPDLCELRLTSQTFNLPRSDGTKSGTNSG